MGIPWPPDGFGLNCLSCFAPGQTPPFVFVTFEAIEIGDKWRPGDPPPPNGTFQLDQHLLNGCHYGAFTPTAFLFFSMEGDLGHITIEAFGIPQFISDNGGVCHWFGGNQLQNPALSHWTRGYAQIAFTGPGSSPSMGDTADEFGFTRDHEPKFDFWPVNPDYTTRIVSRRIPSNIKIKRSN